MRTVLFIFSLLTMFNLSADVPGTVHTDLLLNKKIEDLFIKQLNLNGSKASLDAQITATSNSEGLKTVSVYMDDNKTPVLSKELMFFKGENNISTRFELDDVELWWPNGMGEQKLYRFKAVISSRGDVLDSKEVKHGFRTIEHITESDAQGKSMYFKVNGKAVFMKGANYIPQDNFLPRVTEERFEHLINTAVRSNMNMLRVWGGGIYENDIFYDLCDEKGILVWQDFMFAWALLPPFENFNEMVGRFMSEYGFQLFVLRVK